jgi:hypothetical protein
MMGFDLLATSSNAQGPIIERELWPTVSAALARLQQQRTFRDEPFCHPTSRVLRVYLWSVLCDRPVTWALDKRNWRGIKPPAVMPDQSTLSRRLRRPQTRRMLDALLLLLDDAEGGGIGDLVRRLDGTGFASSWQAPARQPPQHRPRRHLRPGGRRQEPQLAARTAATNSTRSTAKPAALSR